MPTTTNATTTTAPSRPSVASFLAELGNDWDLIATVVGYSSGQAARSSVNAWRARNGQTTGTGRYGRPAQAWLLRQDGRPYDEVASLTGYATAQAARSSVEAWRSRQGGLTDAELADRVRLSQAADASVATSAAAPHLFATFDRRFGVELEFTGSGARRGEAAAALVAAGLQAEVEGWQWVHSATSPVWKVTTDSSAGLEVVSPVLSGQQGYDDLAAACRALSAAGFRVSRRCGMHVHLEVIDLTADQLAEVYGTWVALQEQINPMVAPSRRDPWAQYLSTPTADEQRRVEDAIRAGQLAQPGSGANTHGGFVSGGPNVSRYRKLNVTSYVKYGTFEFRQFQGTLNATKAQAWVAFVQGITAAAVAPGLPRSTATTADMLRTLRDAGHVTPHATQRLAARAGVTV